MTATSVAPFNPNPKWPGEYVQVHRDQGIEESNIPHFVTVHGFKSSGFIENLNR